MNAVFVALSLFGRSAKKDKNTKLTRATAGATTYTCTCICAHTMKLQKPMMTHELLKEKDKKKERKKRKKRIE